MQAGKSAARVQALHLRYEVINSQVKPVQYRTEGIQCRTVVAVESLHAYYDQVSNLFRFYLKPSVTICGRTYAGITEPQKKKDKRPRQPRPATSTKESNKIKKRREAM
jgi:hypothetical protein